MANFHLKNWLKKLFTALAFYLLSTVLSMSSAYASTTGSNLPFNSTMNTLKDAISGPFLLAAAIIMIVITCLMLAFGEWGDGFKKIINIVLWLSVAFAATSFITTMFGSGAVF
jgi:type IV secretory pathway VirB2 component (pilin)